jgi:hypothetical protein
MLTKKYLDELTYDIIGCAIEVHKRIGSGILEGVYHECMIEELKHRKINFHTEKRVPIVYRNKTHDLLCTNDLSFYVFSSIKLFNPPNLYVSYMYYVFKEKQNTKFTINI